MDLLKVVFPRMTAEIAKKTCKMCCMEIPAAARKCPHCHQFQNRASMVMFHPAFAAVLVSIPILVMVTVFAWILDPGEDYQNYRDQIEITESVISFGDLKSAATVAVMGTITNRSPVPWDEIKFHVDFFDAQGKRADVGHVDHYAFYLPPNGTTSFKASFRREFPESNYVNHTVRVLTAKDARKRW